MKRQYTLLLSTLVALMIPALQGWAALSDYGFQATTGSYIDISGGVPVLTGPNEGDNDRVSPVLDIGFTFYLDGVPYTNFSVSDNGLIGLGKSPASQCWVNNLTQETGDCDFTGAYDYTLFNTPHIASFWDDLVINGGGSIGYSLIGQEPNRILVIEFRSIWTDYYGAGTRSSSTWQTRLYEGSNKIEFYYENMDPSYFGNGGSIGLATSARNFLSVNASFNYETRGGDFGYSSEFTDDNISLQDPEQIGLPMFPRGTMFVFTPCQISLTGDMNEGGTEGMAAGDTLLKDKRVMRSDVADFMPFGMGLESVCNTRSYTISITGPSADDYRVDQSEGTLFAGKEGSGPSVYPTITFMPRGVGPRYATLTITDDLDRSISFTLAGVGTPRITYTPNLAQGGSPAMADKDTLLRTILVRRNQNGDFMPFTVTNISSNPEGEPAVVTYSIVGISGGQYSVSPGSAALSAGSSSTPVITFSPTGVGRTPDTLVVNADGEIRKFLLLAISSAAGARFSQNNVPFGSGSSLFRNEYDCVGEGHVSIPISVENVGIGPFFITGLDVFAMDTSYRTGQPPYPLLRDAEGNPIRMNDYVITEQPYVRGAGAQYPVVVPEGTTKTLYFTFVGSRPGKRFGRVFINTNGENFSDRNAQGVPTEGMLSFDVYARGTGTMLSDNPDGKLPKTLVFPATGIGASSEMKLPIFNPGLCALRISTEKLKIYSGDVEEFTIISTPGGAKVDPVTNDIRLQPGDSASITVRFTPRQIGSRRATLAMVTNDSTLELPGHSVRGIYYLDLYGVGGTGLYATTSDLGMALIGGAAADQGHGMVRLNNNATTPIRIVAAEITGTDAVDFTMDATWPALPMTLMTGEIRDLGVTFAPATGNAGPRSARLRMITSTGDTLYADLAGIAGTRAMNVDKTTLTFASTTTSRRSRQSVMITNTGTMPLSLMMPVIGGANAADFSISSLPRMTLEAGQSEMLEVTYSPKTSGQTSSATLTIGSNAPGTSGTVVVNLTGQALKTFDLGDIEPSATTGRVDEGSNVPTDGLSLSGVEGDVMAGGMTLRQSVPNPAREVAEISYHLAARGDVMLSLYDANGRLVRVLDRGVRESGERTVRVDLGGLASGVYHYRLAAGGRVLDRSLRVVK